MTLGELHPEAVALVREIVREEIAKAFADRDARDTIPSPVGDSHSGAIVVPRGSSTPPRYLTDCIVTELGVLALTDSVVDVPGACVHCRMLACVCLLTTDGGNGEGGS